jgi:hypothetical protein
MSSPRFAIIAILMVFARTALLSQLAPQSVDNTGIYEFLDELASGHIIAINQAVKPFSRDYIARKLEEADLRREELNSRQLKELDFYLADFFKEMGNGAGITDKAEWVTLGAAIRGERRFDMFYYSDSLFSITVNPIVGGEMYNNSDGNATYWRNGADVRAYAGSWAFYASLRDNHEEPMLGKAGYLTQRRGGHIKNGTDYSEMQGGVTYQWEWGDIGLKKDNFIWGTNYNGANIFGGRNPSFIYLNLHLKPTDWFEFNYIHGWLNSMVVDSARSFWVSNSYGDDYREKYHKKYLAANMFTFTPLDRLNISVGNSVVYDDASANPAYLFPLFFYKSVDHSMTSGIDNMNSQMFLDVSSRLIKNLHLYATLFVDELSVKRFTMDDQWNFFSWKAGGRLSNFPLENLTLTAEFTYTYPLTFQHYVPTITFESNNFNLGHYLTDNARELYFALGYKPLRAMDIVVYFIDDIRGPDYTDLGTSRLGNPPLESVEWQRRAMGLKTTFQPYNDLYVWLGYEISDISGDPSLSPSYFYGDKNSIDIGVTFGF